jgi:hypothetical protein
MGTVQINLDRLTGEGRVRNLSGKERGVAARAELGLSALDAKDDDVVVVVPDYVDTISPSYFQGLFSQSIKHLHGRDGFLQKYRFKATSQAMRWIEIGIRNATSSRQSLI